MLPYYELTEALKFLYFCVHKLIILEFFMIKKDFDLHIRLSENDMTIIKNAADKFELSVSKFILAVMIPYCLKFGKNEYF